MNARWKTYLLYASLIIAGGGLLFVLIETVRAKNTGFETKTLWDWMELLIIPLVLAIGAFFLNRSEKEIERQAAEDRAKLEYEIATDRQQEVALQAYFDRMTGLLIDESLQTTKKKTIHDVAKTRTLSIMRRLDAKRNILVVQFLRDVNLVFEDNSLFRNADMENFDLRGMNFIKAYLEGASLKNANLEDAYLVDAHLRNVLLVGADLRGAILINANLQRAILVSANLKNANLEGADLTYAHFNDANLEKANLLRATVTDKQLATAKSLQSATMPDGTIHD